MMELWWVSWALLIASLLGGGAWVGLAIWWFRQYSSRQEFLPQKLFPNHNQSVDVNEKSLKSSWHTLENLPHLPNLPHLLPKKHFSFSETFHSNAGTEKYLSFPNNLENLMWRPPPRESLLHRQQVKTKLGKPANRIEGTHSRTALPRSNLPPLPGTVPGNFAKALSPAKYNIASPDSRIGRKRQGLESLVNLTPPTEWGSQDESTDS